MNLLVITAVRAYEKDVKRILKENRVCVFSYMDVVGYKDPAEKPLPGNWFASDIGERQSTLFYVMLENGKAEHVLRSIELFNVTRDNQSKIHVVLVEAKKSI